MDALQEVMDNPVAAALLHGKAVLYVHEYAQGAKAACRDAVDALHRIGAVKQVSYGTGAGRILTELGSSAYFYSLQSAKMGATRGLSVDLAIVEGSVEAVVKARRDLQFCVMHKQGQVIERVTERDRE